MQIKTPYCGEAGETKTPTQLPDGKNRRYRSLRDLDGGKFILGVGGFPPQTPSSAHAKTQYFYDELLIQNTENESVLLLVSEIFYFIKGGFGKRFVLRFDYSIDLFSWLAYYNF